MKEVSDDAAAFKYNLSAFLSAARSVTFFLKVEYTAVPGFEDWWVSKQAGLGADERMRFFNGKRVETIHIRPVVPAAQVQVEVHDVAHGVDAVIVKVDDEGNIVEGLSEPPSPLPPPKPRPPRIEWRWHFEELPGIDVVAASEEHLRKLRGLLDECEGEFGVPEAGS